MFCPITHPVEHVLGQRVDQHNRAGGGGSVQADGGVEVSVPEHGATHQSDDPSHKLNHQQSREPAKDDHTHRTSQIMLVLDTCKDQLTCQIMRVCHRGAERPAINAFYSLKSHQYEADQLFIFYILLYSH